MVDYGWIEDAKSGRRVWEMTYRMTEHAGGAKKNRRFDGVIRLPAGEYVLRYETDGSHSFGDWNADAAGRSRMLGDHGLRVDAANERFAELLTQSCARPVSRKIGRSCSAVSGQFLRQHARLARRRS